MSRFKTVYPQMFYLPLGERANVRVFAKKNLMPLSQLVREACKMRMAGEGNYQKGYDDALDEVMKKIKGSMAGQMKFPSGVSFSDMLCDEIITMKRGN
jgi:hypothetical protein